MIILNHLVLILIGSEERLDISISGSRPLTDTELLDVQSLLSVRDLTLAIVSAKTGLRISEVLSIKVSNCIQHNLMKSHITIARRNMKGKLSSRTIPLHEDAKLAIERLIKYSSLSQDDYLFRSRQGDNKAITRRQAAHILKQTFDSLELQGKVSHHSFRKHYCKKVYEASGKDIITTQKAMAHKSLSSTQHYLEANQDEVDAIILGLK